MRWNHYYWAQSSELLQDIQIFKTLNDDFWANFTQRHLVAFGCSSECAVQLAPRVHTFMKEEHLPEDWIPPDVPVTLEALKRTGFRLGVLSNRDEPCDEELQGLGLSDYYTNGAGKVVKS